jgi:hypothetical protein
MRLVVAGTVSRAGRARRSEEYEVDTKELITDAALVGMAGFGAAKVMGKATTFMYEQQTDEAKQQEKDESYGAAYNVAAKKTAALAGQELSKKHASKAGNALHYALALGWVPVYVVARRRLGMTPWSRGGVRPVDGGPGRRDRQPAAGVHVAAAEVPARHSPAGAGRAPRLRPRCSRPGRGGLKAHRPTLMLLGTTALSPALSPLRRPTDTAGQVGGWTPALRGLRRQLAVITTAVDRAAVAGQRERALLRRFSAKLMYVPIVANTVVAVAGATTASPPAGEVAGRSGFCRRCRPSSPASASSSTSAASSCAAGTGFHLYGLHRRHGGYDRRSVLFTGSTGRPPRPPADPRSRTGGARRRTRRSCDVRPSPYARFNPLADARNWEDRAREVVFRRLEQVPGVRFFTDREARRLDAVADGIIPQDDRELGQRIPIAPFIDQALFDDDTDGLRKADMPWEQEPPAGGTIYDDQPSPASRSEEHRVTDHRSDRSARGMSTPSQTGTCVRRSD